MLWLTLAAAAAPWTSDVRYSSGDYAWSFAVGDLDTDGRSDVVVLGSAAVSPTALDWFRAPLYLNDPLPAVVGGVVGLFDLDGDGDDDLVLGGDQLHWIETLGSGLFGPQEPLTSSAFDSLARIRAADLDADGDLDLVVGGRTGYWRLENLGGGAFAEATTLSSQSGVLVVALEDVDADGLPDLVTDDGFTVSIARSTGAGFDAGVAVCDHRISQSIVVDFDRDGDLDIVTGDWENVTWCENTGGLTFAPAASLAYFGSHHVSGIVAADIDGDLDPDLLVNVYTEGLLALVNEGGLIASAPPAVLPTVLGEFTQVTPMYFDDGDHAIDVVIGGAELWWDTGRGAVWLDGNPGYPDADVDGLSDDAEATWGTDPNNADTDGDGVSDYDELLAYQDPLQAGATTTGTLGTTTGTPSTTPAGTTPTGTPTTPLGTGTSATPTDPNADEGLVVGCGCAASPPGTVLTGFGVALGLLLGRRS